MSELKVNKISPSSGTAFTLGDSGDTFTVPSGATLTVSGTLTQTGAQTFDGGVEIDNFTIEGTEIDLSSGDLTVDVAGDITLDADGGDLKFADGGTDLLGISNSSSDVVIKPLVDAKDIIFQQYDGTEVARIEDNATFNVSSAGKFAYAGTAVTATAAELNILDGVTATAAEINLIDGGTARGTTAIADGDGVLINDAGTMRQTTVETLATYIGAEIGGGNPITVAGTYRLVADFSGATDPIANLEEDDSASYESINFTSAESGGVFSFPSTGKYFISATFQIYNATSQTQGNIYYTTDNSSYSVGANCRGLTASSAYGSMSTSMIFDVTNTSNCKVKFTASSGGTIMGNSGYNGTHFQFIRIGST